MSPPNSNVWAKHSSKLAGGWKCISFEVHNLTSADSTTPEDPSRETLIAKPHGDSPLGRVLISPNGYLSAQILRPELAEQAIQKQNAGAAAGGGGAWQSGDDDDAQLARVAKGLSMYCGPLELFEDDGSSAGAGSGSLWWQTRVEVASNPNRIGGLEKRWVHYRELEDGRKIMTLRPFGEMILEDGTRAKGVLKWEKFE